MSAGFFKTCLWFLNVLIDAVKTSIQITKPRGSYQKRGDRKMYVFTEQPRETSFSCLMQELVAGREARRGQCPSARSAPCSAAVSCSSGTRCCAGRNRERWGQKWLRERRVRRVDVAGSMDYYSYCNSEYIFVEERWSELLDLSTSES